MQTLGTKIPFVSVCCIGFDHSFINVTVYGSAVQITGVPIKHKHPPLKFWGHLCLFFTWPGDHSVPHSGTGSRSDLVVCQSSVLQPDGPYSVSEPARGVIQLRLVQRLWPGKQLTLESTRLNSITLVGSTCIFQIIMIRLKATASTLLDKPVCVRV